MPNVIFINIGPIIYEITSDKEIFIHNEFQQFCFSSMEQIKNYDACRTIQCTINAVEDFSNIHGNLIFQNPERMIFEHDGLEQRLYGCHEGVYGIAYEITENELIIELNQQIIKNVTIDLILLEMLSLEKYLLLENAIVLHSSAINWDGKAIVFSAPSGTGKSTQADLWKEYESADIINGDRNIIWLNPQTNTFEICGIPFCGSSGINQNMRLPLHAIIFLSQSSSNNAVELPFAQAVGKIYSETSINHWNSASVIKCMDLIELLAKSVKTLSLECTISQEAVNELKRLL